MDATLLQKIYQFATLQNEPINKEEFLDIPINGQWFCLPKDNLSTTEIALLSTLFIDNNQPKPDYKRHPWYHFLMNDYPLTHVSGNFRVIHFSIIQANSHTEKIKWLEAFTSMFDTPVDSFYLTDNDGILIEKQTKNNLNPEQIEGILLTLGTDFNCKSNAYLGTFFPYSEKFPALFREENQISRHELVRIGANQVMTFPQVALHYFTKDYMTLSPIVQYFKETLSLDQDMIKLIKTLWVNQGNISSTAKELYLHRNTLHYRIEKFYEKTGLSLKNMDDLALSFLLIL